MVQRRGRRRAFDFFTRAGGKPGVRPAGRPRLEELEDRRLLSAGPLDPAFGNGGMVQTNLPAEADIHLVRSVRQPDGKVVAAGTVTGLYGTDFALERFNADGSLDTSFGNSGVVALDFGANAVTVDANGDILVAGGKFVSTSSDQLGAVARFLPNGSPDAAFGGTGEVTTAFSHASYAANAIAVQTDGKLVVAGNVQFDSTAGGGQVIGLVRYNTDGSLDTSFGSGGRVTRGLGLPFGGADVIALEPDGRIVVGGFAQNGPLTQFLLVRYNTDGSLDRTFAPNGVASRTSPDFGTVKGVAVQSDGTVVAVATAGDGLAVVSYEPNGRRDVAFTALGPNATAAGLALGRTGRSWPPRTSGPAPTASWSRAT
jgi:uncharacterized delta-60 repeat protein